MSIDRIFTGNFVVLFIISLSLLIAGCGGGGGDDDDNSINSSVSIDASSTEGLAPLKVKFSPKSDDLVLSQLWNFGDGATAETINPNSSVNHTYTQDGTYTVTLRAETNLGGTQTATTEITVGSGIPSGPGSGDFGNINLIISSFAIDSEVTPGALETISATIQNIGTDILEGSGFVRVGYYLSTDDKITVDDIYIGDTSIILGPFSEIEEGDDFFGFPTLSPGEDAAYNHQLAVKTNIPTGTYYAGAIVDYIDYYDWYAFPRATDTEEYLFPVNVVIAETNENDNTRLLTAHQVTVTNAACTEDAYEGDDKSKQATPISVGESQVHNFCTDNSDWLKFDAENGGVYKISTLNLEAESDTQLILYDTDATTILLFDDNLAPIHPDGKETRDLLFDFPPDPRSEIVWEAQASGTYFIKVRTTACDEDKDFFCDGGTYTDEDGNEFIFPGSPDGVGIDTGYTITLQ